MTVTHQGIYPQTPEFSAQTIENGDGTASQTLFTAGGDGSRITSIKLHSDDSADAFVYLQVQIGGVSSDFTIGGVNVPAGAGDSASVTLVDALHTLCSKEPDGSKALILGPGDVLKIAAKAAVTSGKTLTATCWGADY